MFKEYSCESGMEAYLKLQLYVCIKTTAWSKKLNASLKKPNNKKNDVLTLGLVYWRCSSKKSLKKKYFH